MGDAWVFSFEENGMFFMTLTENSNRKWSFRTIPCLTKRCRIGNI